MFFSGFFPGSLTSTIPHVYGRQSSNNVATIYNYDYNMEIFLIKSSYYNVHHVEILLLCFSFSPLFRATLNFWFYMDT
jgi:hypothetical protein